MKFLKNISEQNMIFENIWLDVFGLICKAIRTFYIFSCNLPVVISFLLSTIQPASAHEVQQIKKRNNRTRVCKMRMHASPERQRVFYRAYTSALMHYPRTNGIL